jgi:hypothetical protein
MIDGNNRGEIVLVRDRYSINNQLTDVAEMERFIDDLPCLIGAVG